VDRSKASAGAPAVRVSGQPTDNGQRDLAIQALPKELGVLLIVGGIWGLLLPGPIGTPFLIVGGVILWPSAFRRVETCFERRFPRVHHLGMGQLRRFVTDLDRRYPWPQ
jgi:hypothetical protein